MGLAQEVDILKRIPLFANIDPAKLKLMCFASERVVFKGEEVLCRQGEVGDSAFIILDGAADVRVKRPEGTMTVATLTKNDIVGEIAILCDVPRTATVVAAGEVVTLKVTKDLFFSMVRDFPEIGIEIMRVLAHRLEQTTGQLLAARAAAQAS